MPARTWGTNTFSICPSVYNVMTEFIANCPPCFHEVYYNWPIIDISCPVVPVVEKRLLIFDRLLIGCSGICFPEPKVFVHYNRKFRAITVLFIGTIGTIRHAVTLFRAQVELAIWIRRVTWYAIFFIKTTVVAVSLLDFNYNVYQWKKVLLRRSRQGCSCQRKLL